VIVTSREDIAKRVRELTDGKGVPVVFDSVGKDTLMASLDSLQPRGTLVSNGTESGPVVIDTTLLAVKGSIWVTRPAMIHYATPRMARRTCWRWRAAELFAPGAGVPWQDPQRAEPHLRAQGRRAPAPERTRAWARIAPDHRRHGARAMIALGDGGSESMSRGPYFDTSARYGARMGDAVLVDYMLGILHDPWEKIHMGITAENVAARYGITREQMDELAVTSQQRAAAAIAAGRFKDQIVAVEVKTRKGVVLFDTDEHVRADTTAETLGKMKPAFKKDGLVTAGNASGINDGAAAVVLASGESVKARGLKPLARLVGYAHAGVEPAYMGIGPVPATRKVLERTGLKVSDFDVIESNEAFAAQACAVIKELGFDPAKVNPNGSGISLGHPVGATGAIITTKAIAELHRTGGRYALVTMCIGGGQGIAAVFERWF
jgi:acetyl-CoA C-acetyltransferase